MRRIEAEVVLSASLYSAHELFLLLTLTYSFPMYYSSGIRFTDTRYHCLIANKQQDYINNAMNNQVDARKKDIYAAILDIAASLISF